MDSATVRSQAQPSVKTARSTSFSNVTGLSNPDWQHLSNTNLTAADFGLIATDLYDPGQHPDFSATGGPLELGFIRANGIFPIAAGYTLTAGIDNWKIVITADTPESSAVPEPSTIVLAAQGLFGFGLFVWRRRSVP